MIQQRLEWLTKVKMYATIGMDDNEGTQWQRWEWLAKFGMDDRGVSSFSFPMISEAGKISRADNPSVMTGTKWRETSVEIGVHRWNEMSKMRANVKYANDMRHDVSNYHRATSLELIRGAPPLNHYWFIWKKVSLCVHYLWSYLPSPQFPLSPFIAGDHFSITKQQISETERRIIWLVQ